MSKERFIDCYKKWAKRGKMPYAGLCDSLPNELYNRKSFDLIMPRKKERIAHESEGGSGGVYWGKMDRMESDGEFNPLRQTIVLLCAVMEGEEF